MAGFTAQSGWPSVPARIATAGELNEMSFCVPCTCSPAVRKITSSDTVVPGAPLAEPATSVTTEGAGPGGVLTGARVLQGTGVRVGVGVTVIPGGVLVGVAVGEAET